MGKYLIDRDELLDQIADYFAVRGMNEWDMAKAMREIAQSAPITPKYPEWRRTEDELPPNTDAVLAVVYGKPKDNIKLYGAYVFAFYYPKDGWFIEEYPDWEGAVVTHWMPLPELPEE